MPHNDEDELRPVVHIGPTIAAIIIIGLVGLLMAFSVAIELWTQNPTLSVAAGITAITAAGAAITRLVATLLPNRSGKRDDDRMPLDRP